ncbi:MAG: hypothetical protein Q9169_000706 [Polycauliona sp. 2 TL-2023]
MLGSSNRLERMWISPATLDEARVSLQYIEESVRNGALEDLEKYAVGPPVGTIRAVGSIIQPAKSGRTKFTAEDDRQLVNWVRAFEKRGGATSGNEIYKQLESKNPRHTWQSWRDRWVKTIRDLPRSAPISRDAPLTPRAGERLEPRGPPSIVEQKMAARKPFTADDGKSLLSNGQDIENLNPDSKQQAWSTWAENQDNPEDHSAQDWEDLWEKTIRPIFQERQRQRTDERSIHPKLVDTETVPHGQSGTREEASLPVRTAHAEIEVKEHIVSRSPSYHPESPTRQPRAPSQERLLQQYATDNTDGANDAKHGLKSPIKRKRSAFEDGVEVPSSSPLQAEAFNKRLRRDSLPPEILSSPTNTSARVSAREVPDTYAVEPGTIDVIEISDGDDSQSSDEELFCSDASRSLSPELGSSPKRQSSSIDRVGSRTQAAFLDPTPSIEYELAAPPEGWSDEEEEEDDHDDYDQNNDEEDYEFQDKVIESSLPAPEDGRTDGHESQRSDDGNSANDEQAEYDRILEEEEEAVVEVEVGDEDEDEIESPDSSSGGSSFNTQEKKLTQQMGIQRHSSPSPSSPSSSTVTSRNPSPARRQPTTQAILTAETQEPDLSLAEPEESWDQLLYSPPPSPSTSRPTVSNSQPNDQHQAPLSSHDPSHGTDNQEHADNIDDFISYTTSKGHDEDDVLVALRCTNMDRELTEKVLAYMESHPGQMPEAMSGFWTEQDDADLKGNDASKIRALEIKHGKQSLDMRWDFWEYYGS